MGPHQHVEHRGVGRHAEHSLRAQDPVDQRNSDKSAVGIDHRHLLHRAVHSRLGVKHDLAEQNRRGEADGGQGESHEQLLQQSDVVLHLVGADDQRRRDHHQKEVGNLLVGCGVDDPRLVDDSAHEKEKHHLHNFFRDYHGHFHSSHFILSSFDTKIDSITADCGTNAACRAYHTKSRFPRGIAPGGNRDKFTSID